MRILIHVSFALLALAGATILAVGLAPTQLGQWFRLPPGVVSGLGDPAVGFLAMTSLVVSAFFLASVIHHGVAWSFAPRNPTSWGRVLELGFAGSVFLVAALLLSVLLSAAGWLPDHLGDPARGGMLYAMAAAQAAVGTLLAGLLCFVDRSKLHCAAMLCIHIVEVAVIGVVFVLGYSA